MDEPKTNGRALTTDRVLQTIGGILLFVVSGISTWALLRTVDHEGRLIRQETKQEASDKNYDEIKKELKEIKDLLMRQKP